MEREGTIACRAGGTTEKLKLGAFPARVKGTDAGVIEGPIPMVTESIREVKNGL
jgi:hypothetical protein